MDPARVLAKHARGPPEAAAPDAVAPIAPDPFVPLVSTPLNVTMVIAAATFCESVAVAVAPVSVEGANARQISEPPRLVFVRCTSAHVSPAPLTPVTVIPFA